MDKICPQKEIEKLIHYGLNKALIKKYDIIPTRNALMDLLQLDEPYKGELESENPSIYDILNNLLDYAYEKGILKENTNTYRDLLDTKIMGLLTPRQNEVIKTFEEVEEKEGIKAATDNFYAFSQNTTYIRMNRIAKNLYWEAKTEYGDLEITVNLSKPEKDPKEIAAAKNAPQSSYPKCLLCVENVGYPGRINHPARQNHRVIPLTLSNEQWYFQYSPYVYYNEHCIVFKGEHVPMKLKRESFNKMFDFVERFPHYFVGSNADLPIVGGSILSHDHYQGGRHIFPMEKADVMYSFVHSDYKDIKIGIVKWPMSVVRLSGSNRETLEELAYTLLKKWRNYTDAEANIMAYTKTKDQLVPHNTVTPIVRQNKDKEWEIDLVLRNNRTSEEHPDGIYHPHKEVHHIKKENIGLIEVMGLAVLPGRLHYELEQIKDILTNKIAFNQQIETHPNLEVHVPWIQELIDTYGNTLREEEAKVMLQKEVGLKFKTVLEHAGVYKQNKVGMNAFFRFMKHMDFVHQS